jgi:hypothetical protein
MTRLDDLMSDDTNQFGPGTDLMISLLAVLLVIALITSHMYRQQMKINKDLQHEAEQKQGGNFKLAAEFFTAGDFHPRPVTKLRKPEATKARIARIVEDYRSVDEQFPYIFVIGHSSTLDDPSAADQSTAARRQRNLEYALRRAALIAGLMQQQLTDRENEHMVAVTTGEFDLRDPANPLSQENAWVEVVFGREWKIPSAQRAR